MSLNGEISPNSIYIGLDSRPLRGEYHWSLLLVDNHLTATLHHASNLGGPWEYKINRNVDPGSSLTLICLVNIANLPSQEHANSVIASVPADGQPSLRTGESFSCRIWLKDALMALHNASVIQLPVDVDFLEMKCKEYAAHYSETTEVGGGATVLDPGSGSS